jgi:molybdenum cofactor cytidylyltransferase
VIVGILLAAGRGTRFGSQKLLATLPNGGGKLVVEASAANLLAAIGRVIAVTHRDEKLMRVLDHCGSQIVVNPLADEGMGTSLAAGVAASEDAAGWIIALGDMPYVQPQSIARVRDALAAGASIAVPVFAQAGKAEGEGARRRGHPVGFAAEFRDALLALRGDEGARAVVAAHRARVVEIAVEDEGVLADIDTPQDLR